MPHKRAKGRKKGHKAAWKMVKNVGRRCVQILSNGKWRFRKDSACSGKKKGKKTKHRHTVKSHRSKHR